MDGSLLGFTVFLLATFASALIASLSGFAFGLVAASIWLYVLPPQQTATLIVAFGLLVQGYSVWRLRHVLTWSRLWPFLAGGALGVPLGVSVLVWSSPSHLRSGIGIILVVYSLYVLFRPGAKPVAAGAAADGGIGFLNGVLAGITGLAGIVVTVWCGLRGWPKDQQRAVFQPTAVFVFVMCAAWLGANGVITADTVRLFLFGLPALFAGMWLGMKLYGRLGEAAFRKLVLVLLLISGLTLLAAPGEIGAPR